MSNLNNNTLHLWERGVIPHTGHSDASARWFPSDSESNYLENGNKEYSREDVYYDLNSLGYRTKEFSAIDHRAFKIVVTGCSQTFGIGLPERCLYGNQLAALLRATYDIPVEVINLGFGGTSVDFIARVLWQSVPVLEPHYVFCLFPHLSRREYIQLAWGSLYTQQFLAQWDRGCEPHVHEALLTLCNDDWDFFSFIKNISYVELILRDYAWAWDTWCNFDPEWVEWCEYWQKYLDVTHYRHQCMPWGERGRARDNMHSGMPYHRYIAEDLLTDHRLQQAVADYKSGGSCQT